MEFLLLPIEIQHIICSCIKLKNARLIHKKLTIAFNPQFTKQMIFTKKEDKLAYFNAGNTMAFYNDNTQIYLVINNKIWNSSNIIWNSSTNISACNVCKFEEINSNIRKIILNNTEDLMTTYHLLKERDIYQPSFAKNRILSLLNLRKLSLYSKRYSCIHHTFMCLLTNAYIMGLRTIDEFIVQNDNDNKIYTISNIKEESIKMYKEIEQYINEKLI